MWRFNINWILWFICGLFIVLSLKAGISIINPQPGFETKNDLIKRFSIPLKKKTAPIKRDKYISILANRFLGGAVPFTGKKPRRKTGFQAVYVLKGTIIHSDPNKSFAFIEVPGIEGEKAYSLGDDVHGAKLIKIRNNSVDLLRGKQLIRLEVSFEEYPKKPVLKKPKQKPRDFDSSFLQNLPPQVKEFLKNLPKDKRDRILSLPPAQKLRILRKIIKRQNKKFEKNK